MKPSTKQRALISMSGGKDSCMAHWLARDEFDIRVMLTALDETGERARSHGVSKALLKAQGAALGLENHFIKATWADYEANFVAKLVELHNSGHAHAIFGDIDLEPHREWEEKTCAKARITAHLPLWKMDRMKIVRMFLDQGFKAQIVCVDGEKLDESFVGVPLDDAFLDRLPEGVDACGENGEYHSFVYDGPSFAQPVKWKSLGIQSYTSPESLGSKTYHFDLLDVA